MGSGQQMYSNKNDSREKWQMAQKIRAVELICWAKHQRLCSRNNRANGSHRTAVEPQTGVLGHVYKMFWIFYHVFSRFRLCR